jgi:hypothetical protein
MTAVIRTSAIILKEGSIFYGISISPRNGHCTPTLAALPAEIAV